MNKATPPIDAMAAHDWALTIPEPIPAGVYPATVYSIELRQSDDGRDWLAWVFRLEDGREIGGGTSYSIGLRSKAWAWCAAILGRDRMVSGLQITEADLLGAPVQVVVEVDAEDMAKVSTLLPPKAA